MRTLIQVLMVMLAAGEIGCARITSTQSAADLTLAQSRYPVSMSAYLEDSGGLVVPSMYRVVGAFRHEAESCDDSPVDVSDAVNTQVAKAGGNAVVNLSLTMRSRGCLDMDLQGDIVLAGGAMR